MVLALALACHAPFPESVELVADDPPVIPGFSLFPIGDLVPFDTRMIADSLRGGLLLGDESPQLLPYGGYSLWDGGNGVIGLSAAHGDFGYVLQTRRAVDAPPLPARPVRIEGKTLFVQREGAPERHLDLDLPERSSAWVAEDGADGRIRVAVVTSTETEPEVLGSGPSFLITLTETPLAEESRLIVPPGEDPLHSRLGDVATAEGITWATVNDQLFQVQGTRWVPDLTLPSIDALAVDRAGRLWAGGEGVYRRDGGAWTQVLAPWPQLDRWLPWYSTAALWHGAGRPALNAAILRDGERTCGDPTDPLRFYGTWGDCDAWLALAESGVLWAGNTVGRVRLEPPVGRINSVAAHEGWMFVAGAEGVAWAPWEQAAIATAPIPLGSWRSVRTLEAERVDARVGLWATDVWFVRANEVCHTRGEAPACAVVGDPPDVLVTGLAAGPQGAWVVVGGALHLLADGAPPVVKLEPPDFLTRVAYDADRDHVWAWGDRGLHVFEPSTGRHQRYDVDLGMYLGAVNGDTLVLNNALGVGATIQLR